MRPDKTCQSKANPSLSRPCIWHYLDDSTHGCNIFDWLEAKGRQEPYPEAKLPERAMMYLIFTECVNLKCINSKAACRRCGECCKAWSRREYATYSDKPCRPENNNPCIQLIKTGIPNPRLLGQNLYSCGIYPSKDFVKACEPFPDGTEIDFYQQFYEGTPIDQITQLRSCPSCIYRFERSK